MTEEQLYKFFKLIIDRIEGGYYHPNMYTEDPAMFAGYEKSGETMFGLDRKNGGNLNTSVYGQKFWALMDANFKNLHSKKFWNEKADGKGVVAKTVGDQLRTYLNNIMREHFITLMNNNFTRQQQLRIYNDPKLLLNFIYGTWNGSGNFQKFATKFKQNENFNNEDLNNLILDYRTQFVWPLSTSKAKLQAIYNTTDFKQLAGIKNSSKGGFPWLLLLAGAAAIYFITKK